MKITGPIIERWHEAAYGHSWVKELEVEWQVVEEGLIIADFPNQEKHCIQIGSKVPRIGTVFGQALLAFTDVISFMAAFTSDRIPQGTITQNSNFIKPARGRAFEVESRVIKFGNSISHVETTWKDDEYEPVFRALSTFAMVKK